MALLFSNVRHKYTFWFTTVLRNVLWSYMLKNFIAFLTSRNDPTASFMNEVTTNPNPDLKLGSNFFFNSSWLAQISTVLGKNLKMLQPAFTTCLCPWVEAMGQIVLINSGMCKEAFLLLPVRAPLAWVHCRTS